MSQQNKPLSKKVALSVRKLPCDGVPRYTVKGASKKTPLSYSDAHEALFWLSGCTRSPKGTVYSRDGIRRLTALNKQYTAIAGEFIMRGLVEENAKLERAIEAADRLKQAAAAESPQEATPASVEVAP